MIRIFTRQIEKLHSEDGQALVFVALMGLVIFLFLAMTMNVAELVNTKIKNQNVADATALSAAVWQARDLNLVSAANRNMLEMWAAAMVLGMLWIPGGPVNQATWIAAFFFLAAIAAASGTGLFQDMVLDEVDWDLVDADLPQVVDQNYAFKANTVGDDVGVYTYYPIPQPGGLVRTYVFGDPESGDTALERLGLCEILVMAGRYANFWWHQSGETEGMTDAEWNSLLPTIYGWYSPGGECYQMNVGPPDSNPQYVSLFPLGLRTRISDWSPQDVEALLPITVATYKEQEPPSALGKGSDPADCTWAENDTQFACPNHRHYAFASAHAYSESVSEFYNTDMAGLAAPHLVPYIPLEMDWEARLFPLEPYPGGAESPSGGWVAYEDIVNQVQIDVPSDYQFLYDNVLMLNGMHFFLY
jgi:hypothetical protein